MSDGIAAMGWPGVTWSLPVEEPAGPRTATPASGFEVSSLDRYPRGEAAASSWPTSDTQAPLAHRVAFDALLGRAQLAVRGEGGSARVSAEAHARGAAEVRVGHGAVSVGASLALGASAAASATLAGAGYALRGDVTASAELLARAEAYASAGPRGLAAGAGAEVRVSLLAQGDADLQLGGGLVSGHASGSAEAGAGARARASVSLSADPLEASVQASVGAFSGARVGFSAQGGVLGVQVGVHGEAWAGVGARAELAVGLHDGKFTFSLGLGVALGIGGFLRIDLEIDLRAIGKAIGDFFSHLLGGGRPAPAMDLVGEALGRLAAPRPALSADPAEEAADETPLQAGPGPGPEDRALT